MEFPKRLMLFLASGTFVLCALPLSAADAAKADKNSIMESVSKNNALNEKLTRQLMKSTVEVQYFLRMDREGDYANFGGVYCANCKRFHSGSVKNYVLEQRPYTGRGFLIAPELVLTQNILLSNESISEIKIKMGKEVVSGTIDGYYPLKEGVVIRLSTPLPGSEPLKFITDPAVLKSLDKLFVYTPIKDGGLELISVAPFAPGNITKTLIDNKNYVNFPENSLVVDAQGAVAEINIGVAANEIDTFLNNPISKWKFEKAADFEAQFNKIENLVKQNFYPVKLFFKQDKNSVSISRYGNREDNAPEENTLGLVMPDGEIFIPNEIPSRRIATLERIVLIGGDDGYDVECSFVGSLKNYCGIVIKPNTPLKKPLKLNYAKGNFVQYDTQMLWGVAAAENGTKLKFKFGTTYMRSLDEVYKGQIVPNFSGNYNYIFDYSGNLLALNIQPRLVGSSENRISPFAMPVESFARAVKDFDQSVKPDLNNFGRIAYFGVDYQRMDSELAQNMNIANFCENGRIGALVNDVTPGSTAAELGIKPGDVLLRVTPDGGVPIQFEYLYREGFEGNFPWDRYNELPEAIFSRVPEPWPLIQNKLNRILDNIGIGKKATITYVQDGKLINKSFVIKASPTNYSQAPRYDDEALGVTLIVPTFEVRKYFRLADDAPGLLITKIKSGSRGSVSGLKPYEIILSVNGEPVRSLEDFKRLSANAEALRLEIKRMSVSRVINVTLNAKPAKSETPAAAIPAIPASEAPAK